MVEEVLNQKLVVTDEMLWMVIQTLEENVFLGKTTYFGLLEKRKTIGPKEEEEFKEKFSRMVKNHFKTK